MSAKARELRALRADLIDEAKALVDQVEAEDRDFTEDEQAEYDAKLVQAEQHEKRAVRLETVTSMQTMLAERQAPKFLTQVGDNPIQSANSAVGAFIRTGNMDRVAELRELGLAQDGDNSIELRASNDTTMNITTAGDGGNLVPTGHFQGVIARRDDAMLTNRLGVRRIPGKGTSVNVPYDNEADGEWVSTAESAGYDRDAPDIGQLTLTLVKYTKKVDLTVELLADEDSRLMPFLDDFIGRGMAKTHNSLLLTEVAANGTDFGNFASATVIAVDELEPIVYNEALGNYIDDGGSVAWVMQRAVHGEIVLLDDANVRRYAPNTMPDASGRPAATLLGFPVLYSAASGATAASATSVYFGNWNYVGLYEAPGFSIIRDPYTRAAMGEVILNYMFRCDYGTLIAEAIGYQDHPSA